MAKPDTLAELNVYKISKQLYTEVRSLCNSLESEFKLDVIPQLRRAILSIGCNIAEGYIRKTTKESIRYLEISRGSARESKFLLEILKENSNLEQEIFKNLIFKLTQLEVKLYNYKNYLNNRP